jgi:lipopolysaccharide transport system ATP-binding protein
MSNPIISVEHLSKRYRIAHQGQRAQYTTLRDVLAARARNLFSSKSRNGNAPSTKSTQEDFWALKDVSFDVQQGEVLGIIGRNGAGKSTLLKILSRITEPTEGRVTIRGRVASLLEVGTGFHPELTGRENIFLNGAILGMSRAEIKRKFDEIVDFAGVEKFLDTPVKRYSSGMYVRLAFAVAAHLEPEILIVDEVLAVGDAEFQKKCLGKMQDVSTKEGRTVLFVSHNMNAVESLCSRVIYLQQGSLVADTNDKAAIIASYLAQGIESSQSTEWVSSGTEFVNPWFRPTRFYLGERDGTAINGPIRNDAEVFLHIEGEIEEQDSSLCVGYAIYNEAGALLYWSYQTDSAQDTWPELKLGSNKLSSQFPKRLLNQGNYRLEMIASLHFRQWICCPGDRVPTITVSVRGGLSDSPYWMEPRPGMLAPVHSWATDVGTPASSPCDDYATASPTPHKDRDSIFLQV